ncbi:MAG: efflux RND transporter permease subunit [Planctomycetaceae bacterium]
MYWLAEICVRRPIFALMLILALVVAGIAAFPGLGVDRFPNMDLPTVYIRTTYPGAASEEVESEVSQVIEDAVATVAGIEELRSISSDGSSFVLVTLELDRPTDAAVQDIRDAVSSVVNRLPPGLDPPVVQKRDTDSSPIMTIAVAGPRTATELYMLADRSVKNVIESANGVGEVTISGAADRAVRVDVDADRLAAYGLSILQVRDALIRQNAEVPGGLVDERIRERSLRTLGRVPHAREFEDLVVETVNGTPIRISDLGTAIDGTKEVRTLARLNGVPAVVLQVQRQSGENTVAVIEAVKSRLDRSRELLPDDVQVSIIQDQSRYIVAALHEIEGHLISGSFLACLTVLVFMRSWRSTIIASVAIPASIIATFAFMRAFGFTLNNVTMLALVLMVGVVIDDAIVVLENVFHCIEERGMDPFTASIEGTREIGLAVLATTLSLVIVFLPVSFLSSVTGRMLYEFGLTATCAILVSMLVSFTLTPMMCSRLLKKTATTDSVEAASRRGMYHWIETTYMLILRASMRLRWVVLAVSIVVIALNPWLYNLVQHDYIPTNVDESEFEVRLELPEGSALPATQQVLISAEEKLLKMPGIELVLATVGSSSVNGVKSGQFFVRLQEISTRTFTWNRFWKGLFTGRPGAAFHANFTQREKMTQVRAMLSKFPGVRSSVRNLTSLRQGAPVDIDFTITGPDLEGLAEFAERMRNQLVKQEKERQSIVDVYTTLRLDKPELLVNIDRERAAALGVEVREIADTLRVAVGGDDRVSRYRDVTVDDAYDVELRLVGVDRGDVDSISQLFVRAQPQQARALQASSGSASTARSGTVMTRIDNVVDFEFGQAAARIDRLDRQRMVAVRANVGPGYALADRIDEMQRVANELGLPPGYETRVIGSGRELERTFEDFRWTFVLSFIFMYIVLAAQYEHLVHPFTILLSLPLAVPFGLLSLLIGGESLNLYSALGILVLFGVVKKAAILQVDHTNALRAKGLPRAEAILQANRDRLRPILMTTVSFVVGLLPLLIATGPGAEERRSIAVLAVGGQTLSLILTLVAVPVIYSFLDDLGSLWLVAFPATDLSQPQPQPTTTVVPQSAPTQS